MKQPSWAVAGRMVKPKSRLWLGMGGFGQKCGHLCDPKPIYSKSFCSMHSVESALLFWISIVSVSFFFELGVLLGFCNSAPKMEVLTSDCNPVDGKNHAPLMMPEMLFLYQFQNRFGHHKWCTIFSINRHGTSYVNFSGLLSGLQNGSVDK